MAKKASAAHVTPPDPFAVPTPNTKEEAAFLVSRLGTIRRTMTQLCDARDQEIADAQHRFASLIDESEQRDVKITEALRAWAEANRNELTKDGKTKTVKLPTGEVAWKKQPDSVVIEDLEAVVKQIEDHRPELVEEFLKTITSVDKQRMLVKRDLAESVPGVKIKEGDEAFLVKPSPKITGAA